MKYKTTKKEITNRYWSKIVIGYADAQHLLRFNQPTAYTCGVYGWNADIHHINNATAVITGYRPVGNIHPDYETIRNYNEQAKEIQQANDYQTAKEKTNELLQKFVEEVTAK